MAGPVAVGSLEAIRTNIGLYLHDEVNFVVRPRIRRHLAASFDSLRRVLRVNRDLGGGE